MKNPKALSARFNTRSSRREEALTESVTDGVQSVLARRILEPRYLGCYAGALLAAMLSLFSTSASAAQASIDILNCTADLCAANNTSWTITNSANTSGLVNGSGPVVWTIQAVKGPASSGSLKVNGLLTLHNSGDALAPIGNIVINLQKQNKQKVGGKLVPWVSVAADVADATHGDAATVAHILANASEESQPLNAIFGAGNYTVSGAQGTFTETAASGPLTFTDASHTPFSLTPTVSLAPGATLTLLYSASFNNTVLGLLPGTPLRVEALVSFANAGTRAGSGASAANIDINGNGVIDANEGPVGRVRTVACRAGASLPVPGTSNDSVTLSDMVGDLSLSGSNVTFNSFATDIGGGTGTEVINASVTRTAAVQVACSGTGSGSITDAAHLNGVGSACGLGLALDAASGVAIACTTTSSGGFTNGEFCTYDQTSWGDTPTTTNVAGILLDNYDNIYSNSSGVFEIGIPGAAGFSTRFTSAPNLLDYLPSTGTPGPLVADLVDPTTSASGVFGGEVAALRLNVDFNAAGLLGGTGGKFGDLRLCHFTTVGDTYIGPLTQAQADALNGQTVAQVLADANIVLGGGTATDGLTLLQLDGLVTELSTSFGGCSVSDFAQAHLCRPGFTNGEFCSFGQRNWGIGVPAVLENNYAAIYAPSFLVEVGIPGTAGFSMLFSSPDALASYLPAFGPPAPLDADLLEPLSSASGSLGGDVLALRLNVDFSAAGLKVDFSAVGFTRSTGESLGELKLCHFTNDVFDSFGCDALTQAQADALNGQTVAQVLAEANTVLGGGTGTYGLTLCQLDALLLELNISFLGCTPSSFAQAHLCTTNTGGFHDGQFCSFGQRNWGIGVPAVLENNYAAIYAPSFLVEVGIPGTAGFSMLFSSPDALASYLPAFGPPAPLTGDLLEPLSSASGSLGGDVLTLRLNADFNAYGLLGSGGGNFGGLKLCNFTSGGFDGLPLTQAQADALNGQTVAQVLAEANDVLGGGAGTYHLGYTTLDVLLLELNISFLGCTPSSFAQTHLCRP